MSWVCGERMSADTLVAIDLHVHSTLSPCGADEMCPPAVLLTAEQRGIRVLGIVDHSTAGNARAFVEAAPAFEVRVLVGLEVESAEGVHTLALFDDWPPAMEMDRDVAERLPALRNRPDLLGPQYFVDALGDTLGEEPRLLIAATDLTVEELAEMAHGRGGLSIPAHVDRQANGLMPTLGFVPPTLRVDAFELSRHARRSEAQRQWPDLAGRPLLWSSDAHCLDDIGLGATWVPRALAEAPGPLYDWGPELVRSAVRGPAGADA